MNILIVTAHPSSKGFTHQIATQYKKGSEEIGHTVEILDLYKTELQQEFLQFEEKSELAALDATQKAMQEKIAWSDELVIIHPLWWFDAPAIMKNWFDQNFTSGFAYKYTSKTRFAPKKLLKGKTARVFITADGPAFFYFFVKPFKINWILGRLWFCGFKTKTFRVLAAKRKRSEAYLKNWLQKVYTLAKNNT